MVVLFSLVPSLFAAAGETDEPPVVAGLFCFLLAAVLFRFSRDLGGAIGSFYRGPGLPSSRQTEPHRAQIADGVASFWTWGFRLFGSLLAAFAVYILVAQVV